MATPAKPTFSRTASMPNLGVQSFGDLGRAVRPGVRNTGYFEAIQEELRIPGTPAGQGRLDMLDPMGETPG